MVTRHAIDDALRYDVMILRQRLSIRHADHIFAACAALITDIATITLLMIKITLFVIFSARATI